MKQNVAVFASRNCSKKEFLKQNTKSTRLHLQYVFSLLCLCLNIIHLLIIACFCQWVPKADILRNQRNKVSHHQVCRHQRKDTVSPEVKLIQVCTHQESSFSETFCKNCHPNVHRERVKHEVVCSSFSVLQQSIMFTF